ncbi:hypothetical protein M6D81_12720 [Paenibacillus sp. J5C_2022]|uniref:hypothetical protein n=1 Tax=Paenibacillus sp. J5C2022 TaxID=2977129 RepID=UPI0021D3970A|nr:hypothetical protein [Paenibacillus sp. J5C2022]MCU6709564.1 hypothetical protein [Paenibacillus sp. J5C2022]
MIKLLKYDWKRNANSLLVASAIWLIAQLLLVLLSIGNGWDYTKVYPIVVMLYGLAAFMAFLMACQTFNSNITAYSRRLLPVSSYSSVFSPLLLLALLHAALGLLFVAHDLFIAKRLGLDGALFRLFVDQLGFFEQLIVIAAYFWGMLYSALIIFFCIAFAKTFQGKAGTWIGILVCLCLFIGLSILDTLLFPVTGYSNNIFGVSVVSQESGPVLYKVVPFEAADWLRLLFEIVVGALLAAGTVRMMNKKVKL